MKQIPFYFALSVLVPASIGITSISASALPLKEEYQSIPVLGIAPSGLYDPVDPYLIGTDPWVAYLSPIRPQYLRGTGLSQVNFVNVLTAAFPEAAGWSYKSAATELSDNSLIVRTYDVLGTPGGVGAEFHLQYIPAGTDPVINLHWIQVILNNHSLTPPNVGHGIIDNKVDNGGAAVPYYDFFGVADAGNFYDFPKRSDADRIHYWLAETFLVTGPDPAAGPGEITFYGGVRWGWKNEPVPAPVPAPLPVLGIGVAFAQARKLRKYSRVIQQQKKSSFKM